MKKSRRVLKSLRVYFHKLRDAGVLEPGQSEAADKLLRRLEHAIAVKDLHEIERVIQEFGLLFLRTMEKQS